MEFPARRDILTEQFGCHRYILLINFQLPKNIEEKIIRIWEEHVIEIEKSIQAFRVDEIPAVSCRETSFLCGNVGCGFLRCILVNATFWKT